MPPCGADACSVLARPLGPECGCSCVQDVLVEGDRVRAIVIDINGTANRMSLSTKVLEVEPGDMMQGKVGSLMYRNGANPS